MAIVPYMLVPASVFDIVIKIGSDDIGQVVSFIPLIDNDYTLPLNNAGQRCLKFDHDESSPAPSGLFQYANTGQQYSVVSSPYTAP